MKIISSITAGVALALALATPSFAADRVHDGTDGNGGTVSVMKHVCPERIQSEADFDALGGFLEKVLTCPVVTRTGDQGTGAANAGQANFNFVVRDGMRQRIQDATFMAAKLCETDLNADADKDGTIEADVCVDVSHYMYKNVMRGDVTIRENRPPDDYRFGSIEFTPNSGDEATLVRYRSDGTIRLNTTNDSDVMVHVYNFKNQTALPSTGAADLSWVSMLVPITLLAAGVAVRRSAKSVRSH